MSIEQMEVGIAPRRWGWRSLVGAWGAYWAGLAAVTLGPVGVSVRKLARLPGEHATVSLSVGNNGIQLSALRDGVTAWSSSVTVGEFALWVAGPPLALWVLWLLLRPARRSDDVLREPTVAGALRDGTPEGWPARDAGDAVRAAPPRRERER